LTKRGGFMALTPFNFMSYFTQTAINHGTSKEMLVLVLMFPIVATIIAFTRQVIGLRTLGVYIPAILAISFLATGIKIGLLFFVLILILGTLIRLLLVKVKILYLPRIALILTFVSLIAWGFIIFASNYNITPLTSLAVFPMLVMIIMVERFIDVQIEKGFNEGILLTFETLVMSVLCYFIIASQSVQDFVIHYPGIIFVVIIFNLLIGRWTGLRLTEYFRFREVTKSKQ
jgi:hypothetical protein